MLDEGAAAIAEAVRAAGAEVREGHGALRQVVGSLTAAYAALEQRVALAQSALPRGGIPHELADFADVTDRRLLAALARGVPRTRLWKELGMRRRDVDTRMKRLHAAAKAENLFMLGAHASEFGWLTPSTSADERTV